MRFTTVDFNVPVNHDSDGLRCCGLNESIDKDAQFDGQVVWCVGDSFTWGHGVADEDTWVARLNEMSGADKRFRNLGRPGYSTLQEYLLLKSLFAEGRKPDQVLLLYCGNDRFDNLNAGRRAPYLAVADGVAQIQQHPEEAVHRFSPKDWLKRNSLVFNYLNYYCNRAKHGLKRSLAKEDLSHLGSGVDSFELTDEQRIALRHTFRLIDELCYEHGVDLVVTSASLSPEAFESCRVLGIRHFSLESRLGPFRETEEESLKIRFTHDAHWNELGNQIVAETIHQQLQSQSDTPAGILARQPEAGPIPRRPR